MTRWARGSDANKKKPLDGTEWKDMFSRDTNASATKHEERDHRAKHKKKKKKNKMMKEKQLDNVEGVTKVKKKFKDSKFKKKVRETENPWKTGADYDMVDKSKARAMRNQFFKDKRSDQRRVQRQHDKEKAMVCFKCRKMGHRLENCPKLKGSNQGTGICFKCGSTEHKSSSCSTKVAQGEYPYAKCFICGEMGHITRQCPDNPRGLYPKGGSCKECGSVEHFQKDCPEMQNKQGDVLPTVEKIDTNVSVDAELEPIPSSAKKKKGLAKIVKF